MIIFGGILAFLAAALTSCLFFSIIMTFLNLPPDIFVVMANISLCSGAFAAARFIASKRRKKGLMTGFLCGAVIFTAAVFLGAIFVSNFSLQGFFSKLTIILSCSSIGGILGVNSQVKI